MTKLAKTLLTTMLTCAAFGAQVQLSTANDANSTITTAQNSEAAAETEPAAKEPAATESEATAPAATEAEATQPAAAEAETTEVAAAETQPAAEKIDPPKDPVAKAAFDVLDKHCARCHQAGQLGKREKVASNFGNVLKLHELATNSRFVLPGNPDASELIKRTADPVRADMPYDVRNAELTGEDSGFPSPTSNEIAALRDWVSSLGQQVAASCKSDDFMSDEQIVQAIANDLNSLQDHRVKGTRYITLTHLTNTCTPDKNMEVYRQAVVKLLNSLSQNSDVVKLETVDPARSIIRFHLSDLKWTENDWTTILASYPYGIKPDTQMFSFLQTATNTQLPYVRGDWFAFAASRPALYHALLKLPDTFQGLQKQLGLDVEANIKNFLAHRAGFQKSGVSQNNRLIERHTISNGVFWTSYDFAGNRERQSLLAFPMGPTGKESFRHDGGETIFSLPNGFHAYYLNTADGKRINKGPTEIVRDISRKDFAVTNGISCLGCHDQGIRKAKDDVRKHVMATRSFPKATRDAVKALYPDANTMKRMLDEDQGTWAAAMKRAGLDPRLKLNDVEMVNALSDLYERQDLTMRTAAVEFGQLEGEFKDALGAAGGEAFALKRRLEQGLVPRDHFEVVFATLIPQVTEGEVLKISAEAATETAVATEGVAKPDAKDRLNSGSFHLALFSDKSSYKVHEHAVFTVKTEQDCFLTLINVDAKDKATVIFPNKFQQKNFLKANKEFHFPGKKAKFKFQLQDPGKETVVALCRKTKAASKGIKHDFAKNAFTSIGEYRKFATRAIKVVPTVKVKDKKTGKKVTKQEAAGRTAIKFLVN
ncbi:MAG: DUF4384 domain-containing protein [Alphaproteobacteria bacterium]|nr:DUF4384 domain-containing protein [Alphaproteobacteria bacterium]